MSDTIFNNYKTFKNAEKWFLFHAKSSFCSFDIYVFVLMFWLGRKTAWWECQGVFQNLWRRRLDDKNTIHLLSNISKSMGNQLKFGQLIKYNKINIFLPKLYRKWSRETGSRPCFSENFHLRSTQVVLSFNIFW